MPTHMFDPYYETKINPRWGRLPIGSVFGYILIFLGLLSFTFSVVDLAQGVPPVLESVWQENPIWPTLGKGIWVGALAVATGFIGVTSRRERTQVSLYIFNALCWITAVFSFFQVMSAIFQIEPYMFGPPLRNTSNRSKRQNMEVAMNALLIAIGSLQFIASITAALLSCCAGNCCVNRRDRITAIDVPDKPIPYVPQLVQARVRGPVQQLPIPAVQQSLFQSIAQPLYPQAPLQNQQLVGQGVYQTRSPYF